MPVGKNTIFVALASSLCPPQEQAIIAAAQTLSPGNVVLLDASGEFIAHNAAGEARDFMIANLDAEGQGSVSDAWTAGDTLPAFIPQPGGYFNVLIAAGQDITAKGTALTSDGSGALVIATTTGATPQVTLAVADEVVNTGGSAALVRVRIPAASANLATA